MSDPLFIGIVAGAGWGVFLGFVLGAVWFGSFLKEWSIDEEQETDEDA